MNKFLIVYENANYVLTGMNATLEEAKEYYVGNYFTFGTCEENEHKVKAVAVFVYDEWKEEVLNFNMQNNNVALKFDDEMKVMYFQCSHKQRHMVTYEDVQKNMEAPTGWTFGDLYGLGWEHPIFETKEKAINEAKKHFKTSNGRFVEVGWCIYKNNQLNVIQCERLNF